MRFNSTPLGIEIDARGVDTRGVRDAFRADLVDTDMKLDLRKGDGCLDSEGPGMTDVDNRRARESDDRLDCRDGVMSVYDIGGVLQEPQIIDDGYARGLQLEPGLADEGRIDGGGMTECDQARR